MKIQICKKFSKVDKLQKRLIKAFPDDTVTVKSCIDMCKRCKKQPVAKVDGKKLKAKRIPSLIEKIDEL
ncbi:DUF1450 domain-containing protein [Sulfurovum sp. XGS-02]|uniref:DUF1450 domain-containing protein n=1 Tax=Sulfurovum sp. XGS-02 TaxID=2925411 RepID=UPI00204AFBB7|nr:DUF1450 domain-containing protein [Sulfurovum sp. XGS-02]UPT78023.1 DUF1450 domain-containing protein [Sulfurovum sp. XGS-02]